MNTEPANEMPIDEMPAMVIAPKAKKVPLNPIKTVLADGTISYGFKKDKITGELIPRSRPGRKPKAITQ